MNGDRLTSSRFPYLPISLHIPGRYLEGRVQVEALLDTGFDGDVAVPGGLLGNGHPAEAFVRWTLADGSEVLAPAYRGYIYFGSMGPINVVVTVLGDEHLIGRRAITRFRVTLDHGRQVVMEP